MTKDQLITAVANNLGGRTDKNTIILQMLNFSITDIGKKRRWPDLLDVDTSLTLSASAYYVSLPSTVRIVEGVRVKTSGGTWYDVDVLNRRLFRKRYAKTVPTDSGAPADCCQIGRKLYFDRLADVAYSVYLDIVKHPVDMSDSVTTPSILGVDHIIVAFATAHMYMHLKQSKVAKEWFELGEYMLASASVETIGDSVTIMEGA